MQRDRNIAWQRRRRRIPWNEFNIVQINAAGAGLEVPTGLGSGNPAWNQVSSFAYGGIAIGAAARPFSTVDLRTPTEMDPTFTIGVRVLWYNEGAIDISTDSVLWRVRYKQVDINEPLTVGTDVALDTPITTQIPDVNTTLWTYRTSRGIINANKFDDTARDGLIIWTVDVQTLTAFSGGEVNFLGLEIDYMPQFCVLPGETAETHTALLAAT